MASMQLPPDFSEFLKLLNENGVEYLLIGGYAVGFYGYPRYTGDIDVWVLRERRNAERLVSALKQFGFDIPGLSVELFVGEKTVTRLGNSPIRIEILTAISGVEFEVCYSARHIAEIDAIQVPLISIEHLLQNKRASGRHKDLEDVEHLVRLRNMKPPI